jgi:hypothetical protein
MDSLTKRARRTRTHDAYESIVIARTRSHAHARTQPRTHLHARTLHRYIHTYVHDVCVGSTYRRTYPRAHVMATAVSSARVISHVRIRGGAATCTPIPISHMSAHMPTHICIMHTCIYMHICTCIHITRAGTAAQTDCMFDTDAVFHAPMFALNADAETNACAPTPHALACVGADAWAPNPTRTRTRTHTWAHMWCSHLCSYGHGCMCHEHRDGLAEQSGPIAAAPSMLGMAPAHAPVRHNHALLRYEPWHTSRTAAIDTAHRLDARNATCAISARASGGRRHTLAIVDTLAVFHFEMSSLNVGLAVDEG